MNETALTNLLKKKSKWFPFSNCNNSGNVAESSSYREGSMMHSVANFFLWFLVFPFLSRQRGQKAIYHEDSWQWIFARAAMSSPASIWSEWKRRENMFPVLPLRHSAAAADRYSTLLSFSSSLLLLFLHVSSFFLFIYLFFAPFFRFVCLVCQSAIPLIFGSTWLQLRCRKWWPAPSQVESNDRSEDSTTWTPNLKFL